MATTTVTQRVLEAEKNTIVGGLEPAHGINDIPLQALDENGKAIDSDAAFPQNTLPKWQMTLITVCLAYSTGITTYLGGIVTIATPDIAYDLQLSASLTLWPVTIYSLTCGCTLLLCGSISDVVGSRQTYLFGCFLQCISTLACGLSKNAAQMLVFRGISGLAASFVLPSAVSLIRDVYPSGKARNIAFATMGGAQPVGFGIGLVLGGFITGTIGWSWGFFIAAISNFAMLVGASWALPGGRPWLTKELLGRLANEMDWLGVLLASSSLAMISYVIAAITGNAANIRTPTNIVLLVLSIVLMIAFVFYESYQERHGRPAVIPNSLWKHRTFSCICVNIVLIWAGFNAFEQYQNFYFQDLQGATTLQAALQFIPAPVSGALTNVVVGLIVHQVRGDMIILVTTLASVLASLLMAVAQPQWSYWAVAFLANFLNPIGADGIFTVSNLLITGMFPARTQGVAGGVFNTVSQTGKSIGLALVALIAESVTRRAELAGAEEQAALLQGYHAAFWSCMALVLASLAVSVWGLRKIGKVGAKED